MATTDEAAPLLALRALGFTEIDARVYAYLLENEPTTGYRISHDIGKPTANTYKSIASLERLGAVQVDDSANRQVRAVPPRELMAQLERGFRARKKRAEAALTALSRSGEDDRLYALRTVDQVLERAHSMIRRARGMIVADLFPLPLRELEKELSRAAHRGVRVAIKTYQRDGPATDSGPGVSRQTPPDAEAVLAAWPGEQITIVVDAAFRRKNTKPTASPSQNPV